MTELEELEQEAQDNNVKIYDYYLGEENLKGFYIDNNIAINTSVDSPAEKNVFSQKNLGTTTLLLETYWI